MDVRISFSVPQRLIFVLVLWVMTVPTTRAAFTRCCRMDNDRHRRLCRASRSSSSRSSSSSGGETTQSNRRCATGHDSTVASPDAATSAYSSASQSLIPPLRLLEGVRDIVHDYDVFLLDMWGVMHDGTRPYEGVLDVVQKLKQAGKRMIVLSNSSKRLDSSIRMLRKLGFDPEHDFEQIITSGEVAFNMLLRNGKHDCAVLPEWDQISSAPRGETQQQMRKALVLGSGDGDRDYCESCGWSLSGIDEAELIVARGTFTIDDGTVVCRKNQSDIHFYDALLEQSLWRAASRRLPMLVCNPDKVRPDADRPPMPGKIGDMYETALGGGQEASNLVKRVGKPFADVYNLALAGVDRSRVCMVGDALETDVKGGSNAGVDTLWVLMDGIHSQELVGEETLVVEAESILRSFNKMDMTYAAGQRLLPDMIIPHFRW
jgi:HAD superfamily hydrolase (TIGR01450 family)